MSSNNNNSNNSNQARGIGASVSPYGNVGIVNSSMPSNPAFAQAQQMQGGAAGYQNQFRLSQQAQVQALAQAQSKAQAHLQAQVTAQLHAQLQAAASGSRIGSLGSPSPGGSGMTNRPMMKPPVHPPASTMAAAAANMMSPLKQMELASAAAAAARKKKQKLPDKQLQERVAALLPESALYTQLLEFEARTDSALARKKVDIQEALKNPPTVQKTLRIYVFNTFANQVKAIPQKMNAEPPTWTLKIIGRILEDGVDPDQPGAVQKPNPLYPKFSSFFKRVSISLDQRLYPENPIILWESARSPAAHEGFEVKRKGDKEFTANIRLELNYSPEKYKLSPALIELLGIEVDTRPRIIAAIWHYVKARKLQNPNDPTYFNCDVPLMRVFGEEKVKFASVSQKISHHLSYPQPIHLEHKIKLSGTSPAGTACYDVLVDVPFPIQRELSNLLANVEKNKEIDACNEAIYAAIRKIHEHRKRRAFFLGFSQSPVEFINALIESQNKDLKLVAGEGSRNAEKERRTDFFSQPWVEDAVIRYLNRKPVAGSDAPPST
ncbi:hypothetical protein SAY86_006524 [Trapa natans]|uniref:DM2 domain-containing protein n=1 Tax=Trapa natans TaxID=22666 RepID=A0AAN7QW52_TRANT|nr:hypothetical protein SAY86_006524 [Trapa natans]